MDLGVARIDNVVRLRIDTVAHEIGASRGFQQNGSQIRMHPGSGWVRNPFFAKTKTQKKDEEEWIVDQELKICSGPRAENVITIPRTAREGQRSTINLW